VLWAAAATNNFRILKLLVEHGANVNYNNLDVVIYLIDKFNCDVNVCDNDGRSALYDAVDQMSPLIWAAERRCTNIVNAISCHCSLFEQIEAKELLGSAFVYSPNGMHDLEQASQCFSQALKLRSAHNLPKVLRSMTGMSNT